MLGQCGVIEQPAAGGRRCKKHGGGQKSKNF